MTTTAYLFHYYTSSNPSSLPMWKKKISPEKLGLTTRAVVPRGTWQARDIFDCRDWIRHRMSRSQEYSSTSYEVHGSPNNKEQSDQNVNNVKSQRGTLMPQIFFPHCLQAIGYLHPNYLENHLS